MRAPLLLLATAALLTVGGCARSDDAAFGQRVRAYLLEHPEVLEEAITKLNEQKAQTAAAETVKLVSANRKALERDARDPVIGNPDAPITVVEFFDYRCGFCKSAAPDVLALAAENKDVRVVMKEMPILADPQTGRIGVSLQAAKVALKAKEKGNYPEVHRALMAERALDAAAVERIARANGIDPEALDAPALEQHLRDVQNLASTLQVDGTPAFFVGDKVIAGADMGALQQAIAEQRQKS
jgi:protein-disulfide isomerase